MKPRWSPRVSTLMAALFLLILVLPTLLMGVLRIYENILILDTEHALLVEAAVVGEVYRRQVRPAAATGPLRPPETAQARYAALVPQLDLDEAEVLPPARREGKARLEETANPLSDLLQRTQVRNLSGIRVIDSKGYVVASSSREVGYRLGQLPEIQAALEGRYEPALRQRVSRSPVPGLGSLSRASRLRVSLAIPVFADVRESDEGTDEVVGAIYASRTPLELPEALWSLREKLYTPFLVSMIVTLLLGGFLSYTISAPLSRLRVYATEVANGREATLQSTLIAPQETVALAEAVQSMQRELRDRADYIREFASNTAHELKTPLTSLRGAAELLLDETTMPKETTKRFVSNILADAVRMDALVRRILELAHIESADPNKEPVDLPAFLKGLVERYGRSGHELKLESPTQLELRVDPEQLETLLTSLLDNAVRHGAGSPVEIRVQTDGKRVELEIRDHGPPLPADHFDKAFDRFVTTERQSGGTGLGLAIAKAIAEAHSGSLDAHALQRGAQLIVSLPIR